jgi:chondroitin 4-sulfotransferase 11
MPICRGRKFIFIHIPKNAGSTVELSLGIYKKECMVESKNSVFENGASYSQQHLTAKQLKIYDKTKDIFDSYFKFSFVRNPYQRVLSEYFWLKQRKIDINKKSPENFTNWLNEYYMVIDKTTN